VSLQLATEIGRLVIGEHASVNWPKYGGRAYLRGDELELCVVWEEYALPPGRLRIWGVMPHRPKLHFDPAPKITVAASRGAEAIARDVGKRLMPEYTRRYLEARRRIAEAEEIEARTERLRDEIKAAGARMWGSGDGGFSLPAGQGLAIEGYLQPGSDGPYLHSVKLYGLRAEDLLWALARLRREELPTFDPRDGIIRAARTTEEG
jgi:hypothetical protein